jgi:hypothetical protein
MRGRWKAHCGEVSLEVRVNDGDHAKLMRWASSFWRLHALGPSDRRTQSVRQDCIVARILAEREIGNHRRPLLRL